MAVILGGIPTDIDVNDLPDEVDENDPIMSTLVGLKKLMSGWDVVFRVYKGGGEVVFDFKKFPGDLFSDFTQRLEFSLMDKGIPYDIHDKGNCFLSCWRPGMWERERRPCNDAGDEVLSRRDINDVLANYPEALAALNSAVPPIQDLETIPPLNVDVSL